MNTSEAVIAAFNKLVLQEKNTDIRVSDIVRESEVSRSAFYNHFRDTTDVFSQSLQGIFRILAGVVDASVLVTQLELLLEHFQQNQQAVLRMMRSPAMRHIHKELAEAITHRLPANMLLSKQIVADQVAEAEMGLIRSWLEKDYSISPARVAQGMQQGIQALVQSYAS